MTCARLAIAMLLAMGLFAEKPAPVTKPPRVIKRVAPEYTDKARAAGIEGRVVLKANLDEKGRVSNIGVLKRLDDGLDQKAVECLQKWQFSPALRNGVPVPTRMHVEITFRRP